MAHILYEHPMGYILMSTQETDAAGVKEMLKRAESFSIFKKTFSLSGVLRYSDMADAQSQMEMAMEGKISKELKEFLRIHNVSFIAADKTYTISLRELEIRLMDEEASMELLRAVKKYGDKLLEIDSKQVQRMETSMAHAVSRHRIKYDGRREDTSVMQCIGLMDEMNLDINDYYMRIKEMYAWHFPELSEICTDPGEYLKAVSVVGNRESSSKKEVLALGKGEEILSAMNSTIGGELTEEDMDNIKSLAEIVSDKIEAREKIAEHLENRMAVVAPNLSALVGTVVGARLILKAGGLSKLAMCSASTIQVLGAEKALFRAMKSNAKTPKYGLIFNSSFVNKSAPKMRGRISRYLSSKCALASRIDCYEEDATDAYGVAMREMVEERATGKSMHHMPTDMVLASIAAEIRDKKIQSAQ